MSSLRGLLRLEDKVAGEGRRLERLGGPPLSHLLPILVIGAIALHAALLALPLIKTGADLPISPEQDFPLVWRGTAPIATVTMSGAAPAPSRGAAGIAPGGTTRSAAAPRPFIAEPVPEPSPELPATAIPSDLETVIPPPDSPPPTLEPSVATPAAAGAAASPVLVHRVRPVYPAAARALRAEARVTVRLTVAEDGSVSDAAVLGTTRPGLGFESAALEAVKLWKYEAVAAPAPPRTVIVTVEFRRQETAP